MILELFGLFGRKGAQMTAQEAEVLAREKIASKMKDSEFYLCDLWVGETFDEPVENDGRTWWWDVHYYASEDAVFEMKVSRGNIKGPKALRGEKIEKAWSTYSRVPAPSPIPNTWIDTGFGNA